MSSLRESMSSKFINWQQDLPDPWRQELEDIQLDFSAFPDHVRLGNSQAIRPIATSGGGSNESGAFKALQGLSPANVEVVIFGNDPYPTLDHATGRSLEQGNLSNWSCDLDCPGRVSRSLVSILCAAVASTGKPEFQDLVKRRVSQRRTVLKQVLDGSAIKALPPSTLFQSLENQGVLWINRALTFTAKSHQKYHQKFWKPLTNRVICVLVRESLNRPIVFALWGGKAKQLRSQILCTHHQLDDVAVENIQISKAGHPSLPHSYFRCGNPLVNINRLMTQRRSGNTIYWPGRAI